MTPKELIDAFETLADAPDGIARLRELVLQLAGQGKLVPQEPNDEPASKLLERTAAEKARLLENGKTKILPPIKSDEVPFEVPDTWAWSFLGALAHIERGGSPRPIKAYITEDPDGLNWIKIGDTQKGSKYITGTRHKGRFANRG